MKRYDEIIREANRLKDPYHAGNLARFFKTGPGEYGEGDLFLGLRMPHVRAIAKNNAQADIDDCTKLITSPFHEHRMIALILLIQKFRRGNPDTQKILYEWYLKNREYINNWDLVDVSAPSIVGAHLYNKDIKPLLRLAQSPHVFERRIAMIATAYWIGKNDFTVPFQIATILKNDPHDLIQKAVGWMLREIGKRSHTAETAFLDRYASELPRTMLRYAIERFPQRERKKYMQMKRSYPK